MSIEKKLDNKQAAKLLRNLAEALEKEDNRTVSIGDEVVRFPTDLDIELEFEQDDEQAELELEIKWTLQKGKRVPKFEMFKGEDAQWYFHLKAPNHEIILAGEGYKQKASAEKGIASVKSNADSSNIEYRISRANQHYFVLKAKNHEIIGTSQMYKRKAGAEKGVASVLKNAPTAEITCL